MIHYIRIDISKRDFHVCFSEDGDILKFTNDITGIEQFIKYLKANKYTVKKHSLVWRPPALIIYLSPTCVAKRDTQ